MQTLASRIGHAAYHANQRRVELESIRDDVDPALDVFGTVVLAAWLTGSDPECLHEYTGIPRWIVDEIVRRMCVAGLWGDDGSFFCASYGKDEMWGELILQALVAEGQIEYCGDDSYRRLSVAARDRQEAR